LDVFFISLHKVHIYGIAILIKTNKMNITLVPLRIDLNYLMSNFDPLTILFYASPAISKQIYELLPDRIYITQMQYNDTLQSDITDEERDKLLVEEIADLLEDKIDCILAIPTAHYERVTEILQYEFMSKIRIDTINIPDTFIDLQEDTLVYREKDDEENEELMDCHIDDLYSLLGKLLKQDTFETADGFNRFIRNDRPESLN